MVELLLTGLSYIVVFWVGFFVAGAMAVAKRSDEDMERVSERIRSGEAIRPIIQAVPLR